MEVKKTAPDYIFGTDLRACQSEPFVLMIYGKYRALSFIQKPGIKPFRLRLV